MRRNHPKSGNEMQRGAGRDMKNIDDYSRRASENSYHGEKDKPVKNSGYGKPLNHEGTSDDYMPNVRRTTS